MLYKNFLKLSHHETALCFNSGGARLLLQTFHKPRVGKFPNDNSFSANPRAYPPDAEAGEAKVRQPRLAEIYARVRAYTHCASAWRGIDEGKRGRVAGGRGKGINYAHRDYMTREPWFSSLLRKDGAAAAVSHVRASGFSRKSS